MAIDVALEVLTDPDFLINILVRRPGAAGSYVDGHFVEGSLAVDIPISASVQPSVAEDFINPEEGERFGGSQTI